MFSFQNCTLQSEDVGNGDSYWVSFEEKSFCKGKAFKVYSGKMNGRGKKSGDRCVVKVFRKCMGTKSLCSCEMKKSETARELARAFSKSARKRDVHLRFAATYWALMDEVSRLKSLFFSGERPLSSKEAVLFEDDVRMDCERPNKIRRLTSFMDGRGRPGTSRATELDAFTHFSYHESGGRLVVCGLEGVHDSEGFFLKTPTIHSRAREFGNSDGGIRGIREVFRHHVCNSVCKDMSKPAPEEDACEKADNVPQITECATSGLPVNFIRNKDISLPPSGTIPEFASQNSQLSRITNFSDTSNSSHLREIPSAPELPSDYHDFSRSISCPPTQYQRPDHVGASWISRDGHHKFTSPTNLMSEPTVPYMHQNSLPNTLLTSLPQTHTIRDPISIHSTTMNMVDLHIQDENANPWRHNSGALATDRHHLSNTTTDSTGAASFPHTSQSRQNQPGDSNPNLPASTLKPYPRPFNSLAAEAGSSPRQHPQCEDTLHPLPDFPPSYIDSQIATAYWVMQRGYGYNPAISTPAQIVLPYEHCSNQAHVPHSQNNHGNQ